MKIKQRKLSVNNNGGNMKNILLLLKTIVNWVLYELSVAINGTECRKFEVQYMDFQAKLVKIHRNSSSAATAVANVVKEYMEVYNFKFATTWLQQNWLLLVKIKENKANTAEILSLSAEAGKPVFIANPKFGAFCNEYNKLQKAIAVCCSTMSNNCLAIEAESVTVTESCFHKIFEAYSKFVKATESCYYQKGGARVGFTTPWLSKWGKALEAGDPAKLEGFEPDGAAYVKYGGYAVTNGKIVKSFKGESLWKILNNEASCKVFLNNLLVVKDELEAKADEAIAAVRQEITERVFRTLIGAVRFTKEFQETLYNKEFCFLPELNDKTLRLCEHQGLNPVVVRSNLKVVAQALWAEFTTYTVDWLNDGRQDLVSDDYKLLIGELNSDLSEKKEKQFKSLNRDLIEAERAEMEDKLMVRHFGDYDYEGVTLDRGDRAVDPIVLSWTIAESFGLVETKLRRVLRELLGFTKEQPSSILTTERLIKMAAIAGNRALYEDLKAASAKLPLAKIQFGSKAFKACAKIGLKPIRGIKTFMFIPLCDGQVAVMGRGRRWKPATGKATIARAALMYTTFGVKAETLYIKAAKAAGGYTEALNTMRRSGVAPVVVEKLSKQVKMYNKYIENCSEVYDEKTSVWQTPESVKQFEICLADGVGRHCSSIDEAVSFIMANYVAKYNSPAAVKWLRDGVGVTQEPIPEKEGYFVFSGSEETEYQYLLDGSWGTPFNQLTADIQDTIRKKIVAYWQQLVVTGRTESRNALGCHDGVEYLAKVLDNWDGKYQSDPLLNKWATLVADRKGLTLVERCNEILARMKRAGVQFDANSWVGVGSYNGPDAVDASGEVVTIDFSKISM